MLQGVEQVGLVSLICLPFDFGEKMSPAEVQKKNERQPKVLVVDDDARLRDLLRRYLSENGYAVTVAEDAKAMNRFWMRERFDMLVLDLMLPGEDGLSICRRLRGGGDQTPIIMLTAKGEDTDRIVGLEMGADDYLPKPFNPRELLARIGAVLRRKRPDETPGAPAEERQLFRFGEFELDLGSRTLRKNGEKIALTTGEFAVLKAFARNARQSLSRDKLMALAKAEGIELTKEEAEAYMAEMADVELDSDALKQVAGGACYGVDVCPKNLVPTKR